MQRYDSYKDSGVKWLGEIPSHWEIMPIKRIAKTFAGATPNSSNEKYWGGTIAWVTPADFKTETKFIKEGNRCLTELGLNSCSATLVPQDSVVFSKRAPVGQISITTQPLCTNQGCISCVPFNIVKSTFLYYLLSIYKETFESFSGGTTFKEISQQSFNDFRISLPPLDEQVKMVSYLDAATSKIDEAIAQQQKMIDLLNERKQIIINNAVTKGLDPNVKMKPSGIDWIGDIPEHWEVRSFKAMMAIQRGHDLTAEKFKKGNIPVYGSGGLMGFHNAMTSKAPSIVIGRSGSVGKLQFIEENFWAHNTVIYLTDNKSNDTKYLYYLLKSVDLTSLATQTAVPTLDRKNVLSYKIPCCLDINEQEEISYYLDYSLNRIDQIVSDVKQRISLLQERKQIIINDVVTGKVKVI